MYVYVYIYICIYKYMYVISICTHTHTRTHTHTHIHTHTHTYTHKHTHTHTHPHAHAHAQTHIHIDGAKYHGLFLKNVRHGRGTLLRPSGEKCSGDWRDDEMHGKGLALLFDDDKFLAFCSATLLVCLFATKDKSCLVLVARIEDP